MTDEQMEAPPPVNEEEGKKPWEVAKEQMIGVAADIGNTEQATYSPDDEDTPWMKARNTKLGAVPPQKQEDTGFDMGKYTAKLEATESGGKADAKAKTSSATGLHQFITSTWMETVDKLGLDFTLADRKDPEKSRIVFRKLTEDNRVKAEKDLGREPTMVETYLYHFLGNAKKLITAPDDAPAKDYVTPAQAKANKSVFDKKTVGQVKAMYERKFR